MFLSDLSIKKPVLITVFFIAFVFFGVLAYFVLPLNVMPVVNIPFVTVSTVYPGADPNEVEKQITDRIEDAISTISKIQTIESYSMENVSYVIIRFLLGKPSAEAVSDVKDRIDQILNDLPEDAQKPVTTKFDPAVMPVMQIIFTGDIPITQLYDFADKELKEHFTQLDGIAQVNISGGSQREIQIKMDVSDVYNNLISPVELSTLLQIQNTNLPSGGFDVANQEYAVRMEGKFKDVDEIKNLQIPTLGGNKKLTQLAEVVDASKKVKKSSVYYDGKTGKRNESVIQLSLVKTSDGNAVKISKQVRAKLPQLIKNLPTGTQLKIVSDDADFVESSVNDTITTILLGVLITGFVLFMFLADWRSTLIVSVAMPVSIVSTLFLIDAFGFSLNILSLMGLSASTGVLVANSVVVLENIFRHMRMGQKRLEASAKGTSEVAIAVIASTMTNFVVFLPIANMSSIAGQFFKEFALVVIFATLFSLLISFSITPMLSSLILPQQQKKSRFANFSDGIFLRVNNFYRLLLGFALKNKIYALGVILLSIAMLFASFKIGQSVGSEFIPYMDQGRASVKVEMPQGFKLERTAEKVAEIEEIIAKHKEVEQILTTLGKTDDFSQTQNRAVMRINLVPVEQRDIGTREFVGIISKELSHITNAKLTVDASSEGGVGSAIEFSVYGLDNKLLTEYQERIMEKASTINGLTSFDNSIRSGKQEIIVKPKRAEIAQRGLNIGTIAFALRSSIEGISTTRFTQGGKDYDITVKFDEASVNSIEKINNLPIITPFGVYRLSQLARVGFASTTDKIFHLDKVKAIKFTGNNTEDVPVSEILAEFENLFETLNFPTGYGVKLGGDSSEMQETMVDMLRAAVIAIVLTYLLLAAILESFVQPFIILITIPLAMIGVIIALAFAGINLNVISMMAIIMLIGIVVNAAILLLDYTHQVIREKSCSAKDALLVAGPEKLKPILMSSLAIMLGMLPMALGIGSAGAEMRQGMGVVSIGGVGISTFLTLFVIPSIYFLFSRNRKNPKRPSKNLV